MTNNSEKEIIEIRILHVYFKNRLRFENIPALRAAISNIAGREHILFHHHDGRGYLYKYPKIQYKIASGKPMLFCIDTAIEELAHFFSKAERTMVIDGQKQQIEVSSMRQHFFCLQVHKDLTKYCITNWLPLNQQNFKKYNSITSTRDKIIFLEKILIANILSFAKGVGWTIADEIKANMVDFPVFRIRRIKDVKMQIFNAVFETNVFLPNYTGLGKLSSIGFGTVKNIK
jgi:hypothetical protein